MGEAPDFIGMSEYLGPLRAEIARMPAELRPIGEAVLEALTAARDRLMRQCAETDRLRNLIRRAHDAMSRHEPDGVSTADWDQLVDDMAKEAGL